MDIFIARQPILDRRCRIYGYELLHRSGPENVFRATCPDLASASVIGNSMFVMGLDRIAGGHHAFVNITEEVLQQDYLTLIPKETVVLELLETMRPTRAVLAACRKLKRAGYRLALDDFEPSEALDPLVDLADIIKVDWRALPRPRRTALIRKLVRRGIPIVAEKIETWDEYHDAHQLGCTYFQGYFSSRPEMMRAREIPGAKISSLQVMSEIHKSNIDYDRIEEIVKRDLALTLKLLRYINSVYFGLRSEVSSIRHAIVLLGEQEFKRWASLAALSGLAEDKPQELLVTAAVRARMCEILAESTAFRDRAQELFLLGMFSLLEAFLDQSLKTILPSLPIAIDVREALLGNRGPLRSILECAMAHERGHWEVARARARSVGIAENGVARCYLDAVEWAESSVGRKGKKAA